MDTGCQAGAAADLDGCVMCGVIVVFARLEDAASLLVWRRRGMYFHLLRVCERLESEGKSQVSSHFLENNEFKTPVLKCPSILLGFRYL